MNRILSFLSYLGCHIALIAVAMISMSVEAADDEKQTRYRIGPGEIISFSVYGEPELTLSRIRIPDSGEVNFPLVGLVEVNGRTPVELEQALRKKYQDGYLKKPKVSVRIVEFRPFFVNGAVNSPGKHGYIEGLTVRKAITLAGGLSERASERKIILIRYKSEKEIPVSDKLDTVLIGPGDIISIGESLF